MLESPASLKVCIWQQLVSTTANANHTQTLTAHVANALGISVSTAARTLPGLTHWTGSRL